MYNPNYLSRSRHGIFLAISGVYWWSWYREMLEYIPPQFTDYSQRGKVSRFLNDPKVPDSARRKYNLSVIFGGLFGLLTVVLLIAHNQYPPALMFTAASAVFLRQEFIRRGWSKLLTGKGRKAPDRFK